MGRDVIQSLSVKELYTGAFTAIGTAADSNGYLTIHDEAGNEIKLLTRA